MLILGRILGFGLAVVLAGFPAVLQAQSVQEVDLELILAVDASGSVDATEYSLQMSGIALAFRDPEVLEAIQSGPNGRIAVGLMTWAEAAEPKDFSGWYVIQTQDGAEAMARVAERFPRRVEGGTGIGQAVAHGVRLINRNQFEGLRRVIDVSGDGKETPPRAFTVMPKQARFMALAHGVTVNGLAIQNEVKDLERYYRSDVVIGSEAFVIAVDSYQDFAAAMIRKLIREIRYEPKIGRLREGSRRTGAGSALRGRGSSD